MQSSTVTSDFSNRSSAQLLHIHPTVQLLSCEPVPLQMTHSATCVLGTEEQSMDYNKAVIVTVVQDRVGYLALPWPYSTTVQ